MSESKLGSDAGMRPHRRSQGCPVENQRAAMARPTMNETCRTPYARLKSVNRLVQAQQISDLMA
jgi:hypothetical protein